MSSEHPVSMVLFTLCGPKGSLCCTILSVWGVIMMVCLGAALKLQAVALFEDIEGKVNFDHNTTKSITNAYNNAAYSCFGAGVLYLMYVVFSSTMLVLNVFRAKDKAARKRR